ncbi:MAG: cytochrome c oxidase assembly protein [Caldilineaceae bacterium]|nr:cytochrome c oxidase assembly protein [Caldilineaceae bacterium]
MHPLLQALLSAWDWRLDVSLVLLTFATLYTTGWWRLRRRSRNPKLANRKRLAAYWGGLVTLAVSLMSPIDALGGQLFFMHMLQHLITIMISAPLLWLASPFPFILWGLPPRLRQIVGAQFTSAATTRNLLRSVTQPSMVWMAFVVIYAGWHDPNLYGLALRRDGIHDIQHITFFGAAMLYWWHVIGAGPRLHRVAIWARIAMLITLVPINMVIGIVIANGAEVIYPYYNSVPRIWGFSALQDQMLAGVIMWIPGSMMLLLAVIVLLAIELRLDPEHPPRPVPNWDSEEAMVAPGLEHRVVQNRWHRIHQKQTE